MGIDVSVYRRAAVDGRLGSELLRFDWARAKGALDQLLEAVAVACVDASYEPVGRKYGQAGVRERHEVHEHVAMLSFPTDLVGVCTRGLVAMMAVGD